MTMRLGQLARKHDVPSQDIITYLNEIEPTLDANPNSKLNEETTTLVANRFELRLETAPETLVEEVSEKMEDDVKLEETEMIEEAPVLEIEEPVDHLPDEKEVLLPEPTDQDQQEEADEAIETNKLLELLDAEGDSIDLSKITRIKASKKKLEGLKVVGKIDLPEPKNISDGENGELKSKPKAESSRRKRLVSDEELETRRLRAKKKKEEYDGRQEKRRIEKEEKQRKELKESHYRQKLQQPKSKPKNKNKKPTPSAVAPEIVEQPPKPKTSFGKFWRWLNT